MNAMLKQGFQLKWLKPYLNVDGPLYKYWFGDKKTR